MKVYKSRQKAALHFFILVLYRITSLYTASFFTPVSDRLPEVASRNFSRVITIDPTFPSTSINLSSICSIKTCKFRTLKRHAASDTILYIYTPIISAIGFISNAENAAFTDESLSFRGSNKPLTSIAYS